MIRTSAHEKVGQSHEITGENSATWAGDD